MSDLSETRDKGHEMTVKASSEERESKCYLVLEDGTVFPGTPFGAVKEVDGEIGESRFYFCFLFFFREIVKGERRGAINTWCASARFSERHFF